MLGGRRDCDSKQASEREWTSPVECRLVVEWNDRRKNWFGGAGAGRCALPGFVRPFPAPAHELFPPEQRPLCGSG